MADVRNAARDAAYIGVGLGVLAYQRAQVRRRELQQQVEAQLAGTGEQLQKLTKQVEGRLSPGIAPPTGRGQAARGAFMPGATLLGATADPLPRSPTLRRRSPY